MLDTLVLHVPLKLEFVQKVGNLSSAIGELYDYQIKTASTYVKRADDGSLLHGELYHPFESLPSSFSGMAVKFYHRNIINGVPYVSLNASAKILQGHNVYGGDSVLTLASEMLYLLFDYYPAFYACLDIAKTEISRLDVTYSASLPDARLIQPCLKYIKNVGIGHRTTDDNRDYYNTVYFGGSSSRNGGCKVYGKGHEVREEIKKLEKSAKLGNLQSARMLSIFNDELLQYSSKLLRFESTTKKRILSKFGLPSNLWAFIKQTNTKGNPLPMLWRYWFDPILSTFKGEIDMATDDLEIYNLCKAKLWTQNAQKQLYQIHFLNVIDTIVWIYTGYPIGRHYRKFDPLNHDLSNNIFNFIGNLSFTRANNAYNFFKLLKADGWDDIKNRYNPRTFNDNVKNLVDIGIPRSMLQNLHNEILEHFTVKDLIAIDFSVQAPGGYFPPVSEYEKYYYYYLNDDNMDLSAIPDQFLPPSLRSKPDDRQNLLLKGDIYVS